MKHTVKNKIENKRMNKSKKEMTIKKRLVVSNILMIAIPTVISILITLASLGVTWYWILQVLANDPKYNYSYEKIYELVGESMESGTISEDLTDILKEGTMNIVLIDATGKQYTFGSEQFEYTDIFLEYIQIEGNEGYMDINDEGIFAEYTTINGTEYLACTIYSLVYIEDDGYQRMLTIRFIIVAILTIGSIIATVIITNHFLTRFVFQKINQSLDVLADGVHQIRDGNLEYRITYASKDEFTPVCEDFNAMAGRLQQSIELTNKQEQNRKELIAGISHDLRSPLTSIKAYVEGLIDGVAKTPQAQSNYMHMIKTKAEDIDHMVSKLFLFSKMDMGDYPYYPETLDLSTELMSYIAAVKEDFQSKGLCISLEKIEPGIMIYADPLQFHSIFNNVLENSLKYKDKTDATANITVKREEDKVRITIEDNGPGVPAEALDKLFDAFYRSDPSRSNPNRGSGLGLAIIAKAITYMGGTIHAENRTPYGLRIVIELPMS